MTEILSDTASNVSVLKDLIESGSLSSDKQKSKKLKIKSRASSVRLF